MGTVRRAAAWLRALWSRALRSAPVREGDRNADRLRSSLDVVFDARWYVEAYPEVAVSGLTPLAHFLERGGAEGRDPNPAFNLRWYLDQNPDVAATKTNALVHFILHGHDEGRDPHPLFDCGWYLQQNPDVAASETNALVHFLAHGGREGRDPGPLFSSEWYLGSNPDVAQAKINPLVHYLAHGSAEGRSPFPHFEPRWYRRHYPGVVTARIDPLVHYRLEGANQGLDPGPDFDTSFYASRYADFLRPEDNPLAHFVRVGRRSGYLPFLRPSPRFLDRGPSAAAQAMAVQLIDTYRETEPDLRSLDTTTLFTLSLRNVDVSSIQSAWKQLYRSIRDTPGVIVLVDDLDQAHSASSVSALYEAMRDAGEPQELLLLETDSPEPGTGHLLPHGVRWRSLSEFDGHLCDDDRQRLVTALILQFSPRSVVVVGSRIGWRTLGASGGRLSRHTRLNAVLLQDAATARPTPPDTEPEALRTCLPVLSTLIVDRQAAADRVISRYGIPPTMRDRVKIMGPTVDKSEQMLMLLEPNGPLAKSAAP